MSGPAHSRAFEPDRWAILLVLGVHLTFFPYFPAMHSANEMSRLYLVEALVVDRDVEIDRALWQWGNVLDKSRVASSHFSDKPPGTAFLAAPFVALRQLLDGGGPDPAADMRVARLAAGILPTLLLLLLLRREMESLRVSAPTRALCLATYGLGTLGFTYSVVFYGHQLTAVVLYATWWTVRERPIRPARAAAAGFLAASCLAVEYQSAVYLVPLGVAFLARVRPLPAGLAAAVLGAAPVLAALGGYHSAAFGSPFRTGYSYLVDTQFAQVHQQGFMGVKYPQWKAIAASLFLPSKGLLVWSPFLALGFAGLPAHAAALLRTGRGVGAIVLRALMVAMPLLFVSSMVYWAGGWTVGQRHLTPVVPFLVAPAAALVDRSAIARVLAPGLAAASVMMTGIATVVFPHLPEWFKNPFHDLVLPLLREGCVASVWTEPAVGAAVVAAVTVGAFLLLAIAAVSAWRGGLAVKAAAVVLLALLPLGWYDWTSRVQRDEPAEIADDVGWFRGQCRSAGRIEVAPDAPRGPVPDAPPALPETPPGARPRPGATPFPGAAPLPGVTQRPGGPPPRPLP